ncbi:MAG: DMT family transporter [Eubacterium sp.]
MNDAFLKKKSTTVAVAILCTFLWGSAFPVLKIGYDLFQIPSGDIWGKMVFAGLRFLLAGFVVLLLNHFLNKGNRIKWVSGYGKWIVALALLGTTIQYFFFYIGVGNTTGVKGSVASTAGTFLVVLMAPLFFKKDKLNTYKIVGMALGLIGIFLTSLNSAGNAGLDFNFKFIGEGFLIIAGLGDAGATLVAKYLSDKMNPFHFTFFQMVLGALVLLGLGIGFGMVMGGIHMVFTFKGILLLGYAAIISGVAFSMWNVLLKYNEASSITAFKFLIPVFGSLLSVLLLPGEYLSFFIFAGLLSASLGVYLVNKKV